MKRIAAERAQDASWSYNKAIMRKGAHVFVAAALAACGGGVAPSGSSDGGVGGGASGCAALTSCCASLAGATASLCNDVAGAGHAEDCDTELAQLQAGGYCTSASGSSSGIAGPDASGSSGGGTSSSGSGGSGSGSSSSGGVPEGGMCPMTATQAIASLSDAANDVAGQWSICEGLQNVVGSWAPSDTFGMEFTPATNGGGSCGEWGSPCMGGLIYFLVQGSNGLVRGQTNAYQIWYALASNLAGSGAGLALNMTPTNGSWTTSISYSATPREFWIESTGYQGGARLIPAP
jgi:hypothetical protein